MCFRSNISETVRDIGVPFSLLAIARVTLPTGENDVSVVVIVPEILWSSKSGNLYADLYERCKLKKPFSNESSRT